jgi:ubiquinone/menaquinone biosynthesis C-methylase UbiE
MLEWDDEGNGKCDSCGCSFPFHQGVWYAIVPDRTWESVIQDTVALFMDFVDNRDAAVSQTSLNPQDEIDSFSREHEAERDELFDEVWKTLNIDTSAAILEIGAGDLRTAAKLWNKGYHIVTLEPVPELLKAGTYDRGLPIPKICCSSSRLPFDDESFDVVFVQASLHHMQDITPICYEMGRVLKRGGLFLVVGEPYSAVFSSEEKIRRSMPNFSFDIGINERLPRFREYIRSMKSAGISQVQCYSRPEDLRIPHRLRFLHFAENLFRRKRKILSGWLMNLLHTFSHGQVSLWGRRRLKGPAQPPPVKQNDFLFNPGDYIFRRDRGHLVNIWKRLLDPDTQPRCITVGINDIDHLRRGFSREVQDEAGVDCKWLKAHGAFFLRVSPGDTSLVVSVKPGDFSKPMTLTAYQDMAILGEKVIESSTQGEWQEIKWELASIPDCGISEFQLKAHPVFEHEGSIASVMVQKVECC